MRFNTTKEHVRYALKFLALLSLLVFSEEIIKRELITYYQLKDTPSPDSIFVKTLRKGPLYKELAKDAVIFSSQEEVLREKETLMGEGKDFIFVNLSDMALEYYHGGVAVQSYTVRAKGAEGSFSETPNGYYRVQSKEPSHFSKIHKVWMPWSMHFFGNYFIHGWPTLPDGTPIRSTTSGGCIRLFSADAKALYNAVNPGVPVLVYTGKENTPLAFTYFKKIPPPHESVKPAEISASAALAVDMETGQVLWSKDSKSIRPIGALTQLMTALVASETVNYDKYVAIRHPESPEGFAESVAGEKFRIADLFYPLLLSSSNTVAELFKREVWKFVDQMNAKASAIGLAHTRFSDVNGESTDNVSNAEELFRLLRFIYANKRPLFELTAKSSQSLGSLAGKRYVVENANWPMADKRYAGGKAAVLPNGSESMVVAFRVKFSEYGERTLAVVLLGSHNRVRDVTALTDHLENYIVYGSVLGKFEKASAATRTGAGIFEAIPAFIR